MYLDLKIFTGQTDKLTDGQNWLLNPFAHARAGCNNMVPSPLILPVMYKKSSCIESAMHTRDKAHPGTSAPQSTLRLN